MMITLNINNQKVTVELNTSVLDAATKIGIHIPTLCHHPELEPFTSCMLCLVKNKSNNKLIPACSVRAENNMEIITDDEEIKEARQMALELLLSEHVGDCEAPCRIACPAYMNIPLMNRLLQAQRFDEALKIVRKDIALPAVLGRICPAPCEKACKRKSIDDPVSICLLKKFAGDRGNVTIKKVKPTNNKKIAIIGAGPAGLAAAFYLQLKGLQCYIFDNNKKPGGSLKYAIDDENLDKKVLDNEIELIKQSGIIFHQEKTVHKNDFMDMTNQYDVVVMATGNLNDETATWGIKNNGKQVLVDKNTYQTNIDNVFAIGNINRPAKLAVRSVGQGKEVAHSVIQFLNHQTIKGEHKPFNSRMGKLLQDEFDEYLKESNTLPRIQITENRKNEFSEKEVVKEASRCLHCDCRKPESCKLRMYADEYGAVQRRNEQNLRKTVIKNIHHDNIIYEPQKCIKCGICVRMTEKHKERLGLTFIGRGFDIRVGIPFSKELNESLMKTARLVAEACPTGAIALK